MYLRIILMDSLVYFYNIEELWLGIIFLELKVLFRII